MNRVVALVWAAVASLAWAGVAGAQSTYELDDSGEWVERPAEAQGADASVMTEASRRIAEGRPGLAHELVDDWIARNLDVDNAEVSGASPEAPRALRLRGDALVAMGKEFKALYDYERVIRGYPASEEFFVAVEREYDIALRYLDGLRVKVFGLRVEDATDIGIELLLRTHERAPGSELGERAAIAVADYYYDNREMNWAVDAYDAYVKSYPRGPNRDKAMTRRVIGNLARYRGAKYDATSLIDARRQIARLQRDLPREAEKLGLDDEMIRMIDAALAAQTLDAAMWRIKRDEPAAARYLMIRLIEEHPGTDAAAEASRELVARGWASAEEFGDLGGGVGGRIEDLSGAERDLAEEHGGPGG